MKSRLELDRRHGLRRNGPDRFGTEPAKFVRWHCQSLVGGRAVSNSNSGWSILTLNNRESIFQLGVVKKNPSLL